MKTGFKERIKNTTLHKLFNNNRFVIIFSLFLSVILWFTVSMNISISAERTITSVPVTIDLKNTYAEKLGLKLFGETNFTVDVDISGESYIVRQKTADDIIVTAQTSTIESSGKVRLWLNYKPADGVTGITINKVSPSYVDAYFDVESTKYFPLTPDIISPQVAADDYMQQNEVLSQSQIKVTGPKTEIEKIDKVYARIEISDPLTQTTTFDCQVQAVDSNGNEPKYLEIGQENQTVQMTVPILKRKELPVTAEFINAPQDYLTSSLEMKFSPETISIAGPETAIDSMMQLNLGKIDFEKLSPDENTFTFDVSLPSGVTAIDNVETVTVTVNMKGLTSNIFTIPKDNIIVQNIPTVNTVTIVSGDISDVKIVGPEDVISQLTSGDIYAKVDLLDEQFSLGEQQFKVNISVKNNDRCWAYGEYKIWLRIKSTS